jgi:predicted dehydrogenase
MRIAVAGLGFMGTTHLQAWQKVAGAEVAAVVSSDERKLAGDLSAIQGNLGRPGEALDFSGFKKFKSLEEALADKSIDAVDLCLPTHLHEPAALAALAAGKHVLIEKPMALDGAACDRIIAAAEKARRTLMVAQVLRFWPDYQPLIAAMNDRSLGALHSAVFRRRCAAPAWGQWLKDPEKGGGGVFDLLIHDADLAIRLFGSPRAISATGHAELEKGIDLVHATLHYDHIPGVILTGGWHHPKSYPFSMEYTATFEGGTIEFSTAGRPVTLYGAAGEAKPYELNGRDGFEAELAYFHECASNGREPALCDPRESARAVRLMLAIAAARQQKGAVIECLL